MPSRDFTIEDLFSSRMMSMHSSTHSSQINTVGPAMSLRTSCWFLPQNEQRSGFLVSSLLTLLISEPQVVTGVTRRPKRGSHHDLGGQARAGANGAARSRHQLSRKLLRILDRLGCFSFLSALASIWRMRSRVTENCRPTSSSVWSLFMPMPKRMRIMRSSRGVSKASDGLDHVHGDTDGARLVGNRARDRLPDPPRGVGREFVAAAILEFVDRLHQADIAFLDQVEELQAAVGVFLGDGDDEAQVCLHHLLLGMARLALALLHRLHDLAELADLEPGLAREHLDLMAVLLDLVLVPGDQALPAFRAQL